MKGQHNKQHKAGNKAIDDSSVEIRETMVLPFNSGTVAERHGVE